MEEITIKLSAATARTLTGIVHSVGIADLYIDTLNRLFNAVLYNQDDLGMDDTEAVDTLRTLGMLTSDIRTIAADRELARALGAGHHEEAAAQDAEDREAPGADEDEE